MTAGLVAAFSRAVWLLPSHVSFARRRQPGGRRRPAQRDHDDDFDWNDRYNLWSGLIGGTFLALAYFGTDQSQVQRYLSGRSIDESRLGLFFNAVAKIPMQLFILFIGAMVFVFYIYEKPPMLFQPAELARIVEPAVRETPSRPSSVSYDAGVRRPPGGGRSGCSTRATVRGRGGPRAGRSSVPAGAARASDGARRDAAALAAAARRQRRQRHELHLSDVRHRAPAGRAGRSRPRGDLRRDDVVDFRRDERARDRERWSTSTSATCGRRLRTITI